MSRTPSPNFPGWYITFQTAILHQLPRPGEISKKQAEWLSKNQGELKKILENVLCSKLIEWPIFTPNPTIITIPAIKKPYTMQECFQNDKGIAWYRDSDLDKPGWITQNRNPHPGGEGKVLTLSKSANFREMSKVILGHNLKENISDQDLQKEMIAKNLCLEPKQLELLVRACHIDQNPDLQFLKDGRITLIPVDNENGTVSFVSVHWRGGHGEWSAIINHFDSDDQWGAGNRLLLSNS